MIPCAETAANEVQFVLHGVLICLCAPRRLGSGVSNAIHTELSISKVWEKENSASDDIWGWVHFLQSRGHQNPLQKQDDTVLTLAFGGPLNHVVFGQKAMVALVSLLTKLKTDLFLPPGVGEKPLRQLNVLGAKPSLWKRG